MLSLKTIHSKIYRLGPPLLIALVLLAWPTSVLAHPLGNFTINRYSRLELSQEQVQLHYIVDMAEIPTFQLWDRIDTDRDGLISPTEERQYLTHQVSLWQSQLRFVVNDRPLQFSSQEQSLEVLVGQGGLNTLRVTVDFVAPLPAQQLIWQAEYHDNNYPDRLGWQEVVVQAKSGVNLLESTVPSQDITSELRNYPDDLLQSPLTVNEATFQFEPGVPAASSESLLNSASTSALPSFGRELDEFANMITMPVVGPGALLVALLAAFGWGAAHALTPGHGKTIVAAYLVGSRGTVRHAVFLGLTTTLTHTAGVFLLGFLTLFAARFILPEQLYPWLGVMSGALVVGIGLSLFRGRLVGLFQADKRPHHHHHDPVHSDHHHHDHDHDHSHLPPGADDTPITWRSLLALGISGGLIPCPSALVVMLSAIALQRIGFGLVLIVTFSLGLAGVLTAIGVLWVQAGHLLERASRRWSFLEQIPGRGRWLQVLPAASALFITLVGLGITLQALSQTGLL
jgi:ABC-type nickel/cobalt efflux system permease component RcnA